MSIKEYFDINELFHPSMFYTGEVAMGNTISSMDIFSLNSKTKSGKSRYLDFLEREYYGPLAKVLNSVSLAHLTTPVLSLSHTEEGTRSTKFSFKAFVQAKINGSFNSEKHNSEYLALGDKPTQEEVIKFLKKIQRDDRKIYEDVITKGKLSPYFMPVVDLYNEYILDTRQTIPFIQFITGIISGAEKTTQAADDLGVFFDKTINVEGLISCFDYDKLCLMAAYSIMEGCKIVELAYNSVHNPAIYITKYMEAVEAIRQKVPKYNCAIKVYDEKKGQVRLCDIDEVLDEFRALLARHPEFRRFHISLDRIYELLEMYGYDEEFIANFDLQTKDAEIVIDILQQIERHKSLLASWNIIPKGKKDRPEPLPVPTDSRISLPEQEKIRRMIISKSYLENSSYLFRLEGINEFEGYQGYLYPNGTVIFEKYYDNIKTKKVASGSATYVMKLDNFVEVSKLTKTEIISKINNGEIEGVSRIFHREDMERWKADVERAITGSDYTVQVEQYIDELIDTKKVSKKGVKQ